MKRKSVSLAVAGFAAETVILLSGVRAADRCCDVPKTVTQNNTTLASETKHARTVNLTIDGMTCEACSASIKTALRKLPGVGKIDIRFERKGGTVEYDPAKVDEKAIVDTVNKTGFKATAIAAAKS